MNASEHIPQGHAVPTTLPGRRLQLETSAMPEGCLQICHVSTAASWFNLSCSTFQISAWPRLPLLSRQQRKRPMLTEIGVALAAGVQSSAVCSRLWLLRQGLQGLSVAHHLQSRQGQCMGSSKAQ